jgi:hypothetical protein
MNNGKSNNDDVLKKIDGKRMTMTNDDKGTTKKWCHRIYNNEQEKKSDGKTANKHIVNYSFLTKNLG